MHLHIEAVPVEQASTEALVFICFESAAGESDPPLSLQDGWLQAMRESGEFTGKLYELGILHRPAGIAAKRLVVVGGGKREKFSTVEARRVAGAVVRSLGSKGVRKVTLVLEPDSNASELLSAAAEGAVLGGWEADKYKSDPKKHDKAIETFGIAVAGLDNAALNSALEKGRIIGESQNLTRDLVNEPPNVLIPSKLVEAAQKVAAEFGLVCDVLDQAEMKKLGMGALLGVAQGSDNAPFLIALKYVAAEAGSKDQLALIGKGVTFDTGGISIKPADGMEKMKYDMAGAGAVIAAMRALAQLKPKVSVTGYIPTVENMINGNAQRPGDIVTTMSGKTVEVLNTDAEGRLILADALTYAKQQGATYIVDAATLTGAIGIALGHHNMGAFTNDEDFLKRFMTAVHSAGEKAWQLPMDEEYKEYLKSAFADLPNIGGRHGGSITAAWFLREFADPTPWIHLDIAATAWIDEGKAWLSKGPTGVAARSFIQLAMNWD